MPTLLVLGAPEVRADDGAPIPALAGQDKRLALLAFLALERPDGIRRDTLLPLFWPELDDAHARNALRQALSLLRRELGPHAVLGHGAETLAVSPSALECDALRMEALLSAKRPTEALPLYRGEFLEGLHVADCAELSRWIDDRRERYRTMGAGAAREAAEQAFAEGRGEEALAAARRAVAIAPYAEAGWRVLLEVEARTSGRASALGTYETLRKRLREDLGSDPEPATAFLAQAIAAGEASAPFSPPRLPRGGEPSVIEATGGTAAPATTARNWFRSTAILVGGVAAIALIAFSVRSRPRPPVLDRSVVYVDRFRTTGGDSALLVLQDGLPELFAFLFTGVGGPRAVDPALAARGAEGGGTEEQAAITRAKSLGAGWLIRGSAVQVGPRLILNAQLLDAASGKVEAEGAAEGPPDSLLALVERVAGQVLAGKAQVASGSLSDLLTRAPSPLKRFLAGLALYRKGQYRDAMARFSEAIALDSTFALAAVYLANASVWTGSGVIDAGAVRVAQRNQARLPSPLQALVGAYASLGTWADRRRAWELAAHTMPNEPAAWERLGDQLFHEAGFLADSTALAESREAFERAVALDSTRGTPLLHLMDLAARRGDSAATRVWGKRFLVADSAGELREYAEWRMAVARNRGGSGLTVARLSAMTAASRREIIGTAVLDGVDPSVLDPAERATRTWMAESVDNALRYRTATQLFLARLGRGDSTGQLDAANLMEEAERKMRGGGHPILAWYTEVLAALYASGPRGPAERSVPRLEAVATAGAPPAQEDGALLQAYAAAVLALWHHRASDEAGARRYAQRATRLSDGTSSALAAGTVSTMRAILAAETDPAGFAGLDSLVRAGPLGNILTEGAASLALARGLVARGDTAGALDALGRRRYYQPLPVFSQAFREEEARLRRQ